MTAGSGWTPGKIVLVVVAVLGVLGILCCAGVWFMGGRHAYELGMATASLTEKLKTAFKTQTPFALVPNDAGELVFAVGISGDLGPERVREAQDLAWKAYADAFKDGGFPLKHVGVGEPGSEGVVRWSRNTVTVEEVAARTGVPAPPLNPLLTKARVSQIRMQVRKEDLEGGREPAETKTGEEGGGERAGEK